jgi:hypothetical protein
MDAYDRYNNLGEKIFSILLSSMVEAENFSGHPMYTIGYLQEKNEFIFLKVKYFSVCIKGTWGTVELNVHKILFRIVKSSKKQIFSLEKLSVILVQK